MSLELIFVSLGGIFLGILTGFLPGLSINNLLPILITMTFFSSIELTIFIVSCSVAQILAQFFPSIFLGAPNENSAISVLPGHRLLLQGRGYEAYKICLISCLISLAISVTLLLFLQQFFKDFYYKIREYVFYLIFFVAIFMILTERKIKKIIFAFSIFMLSGFLGLITLNSPYSSTNLMFPLLSGFFGLSTLIVSLKEKSYLPKQKIDEKVKITKVNLFKSSFTGTIFGLIVGFLPGVGVSQAAVLAQTILSLSDPRSFLATIASISLANEVFSLNSLYLVGNPRSGTSVAVQKIMKKVG